jgi:tetratricopeptide (TPR) repeat protein
MRLPTPFLRALVAGLALVAGSRSVVAQEHGEDAHDAAPAKKEPVPTGGKHLVSVSRQDSREGPTWSLLCEEVPLEEALRAFAKKAGLALEGAELLPRGAEVTVDLRRRKAEELLEIVLGSHGLTFELVRGSLVVHAGAHEPEELLRDAQEAWRRVQAEGDEHAAVRARLAQGNLAEVRGDLEGAYRLYAELAEEELSPDGCEAMYRAGRILERLGHWAEAAQHFRTLASIDEGKLFHARARLELARVSIELGDAKSAVHLLNFLETNYTTLDPVERSERRLVRARAFNAVHEYVEALRVLEEGEVVSAPEAEARALEVRAVAFEGLGFHVESARAWLIFARETDDEEARVRAFEQAGELSLEAGDELGALFVCREAAKHGADEGLGDIQRRARLRLGLDEADVPTTIVERLELAERRLADGDARGAGQLFESLYLARGALPLAEQARVLAGWARVVHARSGLEAAIEVLSRSRAGLEEPEAQSLLDLTAAGLFEAEGLYEQAAEAYRGLY